MSILGTRTYSVGRSWLVAERGSPMVSNTGLAAGILRAGAGPDAVDHLQGHVISGSRGRYIDPMVAYDLVAVVGRVPMGPAVETWVNWAAPASTQPLVPTVASTS